MACRCGRRVMKRPPSLPQRIAFPTHTDAGTRPPHRRNTAMPPVGRAAQLVGYLPWHPGFMSGGNGSSPRRLSLTDRRIIPLQSEIDKGSVSTPDATSKADVCLRSPFHRISIGIEMEDDPGSSITGSSSEEVAAEKPKKKGLTWFGAAYFIVADLVGVGVVAMPVAFIETGLAIGTMFMLIICSIFAFTGHLLGVCWSIMQQRWEVYREHCHEPYPEIGQRSMGSVGRMASYITCYTTLFGLNVVYVLLCARILWNFFNSINLHLPFCWYIVILCAAILPVTFLRSPANFWFFVFLATLLTFVAVVLLVVGISIDVPLCAHDVEQKEITFLNSLLSIGIFLFAFNGHSVFPTIQHDMNEPKDFTKSIILGFAACALLYIPLSIFAFLVYGNSMHSSVIESVQTRWIRDTADISIGLHCILTLLLTINPINQKFEKIFGAPDHFGWARLIIRTSVMGSVFFVALTVPDFSPVMNVFGATTIPFACVILPISYSLWLEASHYDENVGDYVVPSIKE